MQTVSDRRNKIIHSAIQRAGAQMPQGYFDRSASQDVEEFTTDYWQCTIDRTK